MEWLISKSIKKWLGVPNSLTNVALYSSSTKLKLPMLSLVEEYKLGKARLFQMLRDSRDPLVKNAQPSVENAEAALRMKEIIGSVANGKAGLGLPTSTALVVKRIHGKQKKNGVGRNLSS